MGCGYMVFFASCFGGCKRRGTKNIYVTIQQSAESFFFFYRKEEMMARRRNHFSSGVITNMRKGLMIMRGRELHRDRKRLF